MKKDGDTQMAGFLSQSLALLTRPSMTCERTTLSVSTDDIMSGFQPSFESSASFLLISSSVPEISLYSMRLCPLEDSLSYQHAISPLSMASVALPFDGGADLTAQLNTERTEKAQSTQRKGKDYRSLRRKETRGRETQRRTASERCTGSVFVCFA